MKKVLIAVGSTNPLTSSFFSKALAETYALGVKEDIDFDFFWSPDESSYRNEAVEQLYKRGIDTLVLIKPHIQWVPLDLINLIKNDSLVEVVATRNFYSPDHNFKVLLNPITDDSEQITAKFTDFDFCKIEKEVFDRIKDFILTVSFTDKENTIEQVPMYWYSTASDSGPVNQDFNFCLCLDKAEIPIIINMDVGVWEHVWAPYKSHLGQEFKKDFIKKGFKIAENS